MVALGPRRGGNGSWSLMEFQFGMIKIMEMDGGDGCTNVNIFNDTKLLNVSLKMA
jgi:hypothetical protein